MLKAHDPSHFERVLRERRRMPSPGIRSPLRRCR